jgi:carboxymethylenebutenolidase
MSQLEIAATDGSGTFTAYQALPKIDRGKSPAIIVIQEIFGVTKFLRDTCDHYASLGYIAVAPDLFWRLEPGLDLDPGKEADLQKGFSLYPRFDADAGIADIQATLSALRGQAACSGKVGAVGYCLGGKLAYLTACRTDADGAVGYYGVGIQDLLGEAEGITADLILHIAGKDEHVNSEAQEKIVSGLKENPHVTLYTYPEADHAFARVGGPHYDAGAAKLANQRTEAFFAQKLR